MRTYDVFTLFGHEREGSLIGEKLERLLTYLEEGAAWFGETLELRTYIEREGKNVGPGTRKCDAHSFAEIIRTALPKGRFESLELREHAAKAEKRDPVFFLQVDKHWGYSREGYSERTRYGAENSVTIAVSTAMIRGDQDRVFWMTQAKRYFRLCSGIVGIAEADIPWGKSAIPGLVGRLIEYRFKDIPMTDYKWGYLEGQLDMATEVPFLPWGLFLGPGHVAALGGIDKVLALPHWAVKDAVDDHRAFLGQSTLPGQPVTVPRALLEETLSPIFRRPHYEPWELTT